MRKSLLLTNHYPTIAKKYDAIEIILLMILILSMWLPLGVSMALFSIMLVFFFLNNQSINKRLVFKVGPLLLIMAVGILSGISNMLNEDFYLYFKDIFYFLNPIILILLGYYVADFSNNVNRVLRVILLFCVVSSLYFNIEYILSIVTNLSLNLEDRYTYEVQAKYPLLGFLIIYASKVSKYDVFSNGITNILFVLFASLIVTSFSRTNILIALIIFSFPFLYRYVSIKVQIFIALSLIISTIFFSTIFTLTAPEKFSDSFVDKVMNSYAEIIVDNKDSGNGSEMRMSNINNYWRAHEAYLGLSKVHEGGISSVIFGKGMGAYIYGGDLFESKMKQIPFFHNGYITVYLKSGLIGLMLLMFFIFSLSSMGRNPVLNINSEYKFLFFISTGTSIIFLIQTWFVMGMYSSLPFYAFLILIGVIMKCKLYGFKATRFEVGTVLRHGRV